MSITPGRLAQRGFALVEALVTVLVISAGLLGIAAVLAVAVNSTAIARYHSMAAIQTSSLAGIMITNPRYWGVAGTPAAMTCVIGVPAAASSTTTVNPPSAILAEGSGTPPTCSASMTAGGALSALSQDCTTAVCTPQQLAAYDLRQWGANLAVPGGLVDPVASIQCAAPAATTAGAVVNCLAKLTWTERNITLNAPGASVTGPMAGGTSASQSYSQLVQIAVPE